MIEQDAEDKRQLNLGMDGDKDQRYLQHFRQFEEWVKIVKLNEVYTYMSHLNNKIHNK